jgi:hypothetical protein
VIEKCNLSGDYFNAYLHQNYVEFFSEIPDLVRASEYLSDSDFLTFEWSVSSRSKSTDKVSLWLMIAFMGCYYQHFFPKFFIYFVLVESFRWIWLHTRLPRWSIFWVCFVFFADQICITGVFSFYSYKRNTSL